MNARKPVRDLKPMQPLFAALGMADLALEKLRGMGASTMSAQGLEDLQGRAATDLGQAVEGAKQLPARALNQTLDAFARTQTRYRDLAQRGRHVMAKTREEVRMPSGADLLHQAEDSFGKSREAAARAARDTRRAATATISTVRSEADHVVDDTRRAANATLRTVRAEAGQLVEAVAHPSQLVRRAGGPLRRRANAPSATATPPAPVATARTTPKPKAARKRTTAPARKAAAAKRAAEG